MIIYVSPEGKDDGAGTEADPLQSLAGARDRVRSLLEESGDDIRVQFRGGTYRITDTVVFDLRDSVPDGRAVSYEAYPGEKPVFSAGIPLEGWKKLGEDAPAHLPAGARGNVWAASLPVTPGAGFTFNSLFAGERRIPRARGAGFALEEDDSIPEKRWCDACTVPEGAVDTWADVGNAELVVIPNYTWTMNILPVKTYDPESRKLETTVPCTYLLRPNRRAETVWIENVLAVLTKPGSWAADYASRTIYYWPEGDAPEAELVIPGLTEMIRIEGEIDYDDPADEMVKNLRFSGLSFRHGGRYPFHGQTGWGMQHDWEAFDRPTAMVRLRGARGCTFDHCDFSHSDGTGIRFDLSCMDNAVTRSSCKDLGGCGVVFCGYGPGTKDVNKNNELTNCHIHHIGRVNWHSPGVFVWQSGGNRIAHNDIHHTPYTGIVVSGRIRLNKIPNDIRGVKRPGKGECSNTIRWSEVEPILGSDYDMPEWHNEHAWKADWDKRKGFLHCRNNVLEYNDIHQVMEIMGDGNGVYISGTGAGNQVRFNAVHDCPSPSMAEALRCDDDQHETTLHGNLIYRIGGMATGITIKGINVLTNNIIALPLSERTARGMISLEVGPLHGTVIERNILYAGKTGQEFYFQYRRIHGTGPEPLLRDCDADRNLYWCREDESRAARFIGQEQAFDNETNTVAADPLFVDADNGDFTLKPDSPAFGLGFEAIDYGAIGIEEE